MRRAAPVVLLVALAALIGWYVIYARRVVQQLRYEAEAESVMYARVWQALADTTEGAAVAALTDLARHISERGVPVVITDRAGRLTAWANVPVDTADEARMAEYVRELDVQNPPVPIQGVGVVHYGNTVLVRGLRVIPLVQAGLIVLLGVAAIYAIWARGRAEQERAWAGMAREAAHQLGTPLTSLAGWVELLSEEEGSARTATAVSHMSGDLERLERVAHRFERIGTPPREEPVDLSALAGRVAGYFRARVPRLASAVSIVYLPPPEPVVVQGDPVLLEWALEALLKNSVDALAGRGGTVEVLVEALPGSGARVRISDDGPGIPRENRARIFDAGFSTKAHGWGIGLSLARRIVEDNHHGRLALAAADRGAAFDVILP
ncbi:MAG TPA: HAMP domain-containing sensor histidine kinase [Gemmatimonadaceae bacterium]|nr:HAMP domain-containing sensor histidine kinase [Gemmatimonadaceae bacterium]